MCDSFKYSTPINLQIEGKLLQISSRKITVPFSANSHLVILTVVLKPNGVCAGAVMKA